jgi:hypothetical protein
MNTIAALSGSSYTSVPMNQRIRGVSNWSLGIEDRPNHKFPAPMTNVMTNSVFLRYFKTTGGAVFYPYSPEEVSLWCEPNSSLNNVKYTSKGMASLVYSFYPSSNYSVQ